jgi:hypothetical protein
MLSGSKEVSIDIVVHLFKIFKTIFFQIFGAREGRFWVSEVSTSLNFEFGFVGRISGI